MPSSQPISHAQMRNIIKTDKESRKGLQPWQGDGLRMKLLLSYCRHSPRFRGRGLVYRCIASLFFRNELRFRGIDNARFTIDATDFIGRAVAFDGNYEPKSLALAREIMAAGGVFLDVGCNVGLYSIAVASQPGVRLIAIDASFVALNKLRQNLFRNPSVPAEIVCCALGLESPIQCFETPLSDNLGTTKVSENHRKADSSRFWVATESLQSVLERLAAGKIRLLKIDVEGSELDVLRGLDFESDYRPDNIIAECDPDFPKALECFEFLRSKGYDAFTIDGEVARDGRDLPEMNVWFRSALAAGTIVPEKGP